MPSGGGDARGDLMSQIQAGRQLKKAAIPEDAPAPSAGRDDLLAAIRGGGVKLKHREVSDEPKAAPAGGNDLASTLAQAMASRRAAQDSDDSDESDWDDD
jgi:hypothetical protein